MPNYRVLVERDVTVHEVQFVRVVSKDEVVAGTEAMRLATSYGSWVEDRKDIGRYEVTLVREEK